MRPRRPPHDLGRTCLRPWATGRSEVFGASKTNSVTQTHVPMTRSLHNRRGETLLRDRRGRRSSARGFRLEIQAHLATMGSSCMKFSPRTQASVASEHMPLRDTSVASCRGTARRGASASIKKLLASRSAQRPPAPLRRRAGASPFAVLEGRPAPARRTAALAGRRGPCPPRQRHSWSGPRPAGPARLGRPMRGGGERACRPGSPARGQAGPMPATHAPDESQHDNVPSYWRWRPTAPSWAKAGARVLDRSTRGRRGGRASRRGRSPNILS